MIVPVMAISNLVLTRQIYSEETNGAHSHHREPVPLKASFRRFWKAWFVFTLADDSIHVFSFDYVVKEISKRCSCATIEL